MIPNEGYAAGNMQGSGFVPKGVGLASLMSLIGSKGPNLAGIAGSVIPQKGVGNVLGGAASGAATGSMFGPVGTAIGAAVGGIGGALNWRQKQHQQQMEALKQIRGRMNG